jgi:hypothetical protein
MTPITFVSFIFSLAFVDFRYSLIRSHNHAEQPSRMPSWLHHVLYRPSPYQYVRVKDSKVAQGQDEHGNWYYHSMQKKLMRMEVDEAFQIRGTVMLLFGLVLALITWGAWVVGSYVSRLIRG